MSLYGLKEIDAIIKTGACEFVLISYTLWIKEMDVLENIIKSAEKVNTKVHIIDETHEEIVTILNSFGGIIAVLRYKIDF